MPADADLEIGLRWDRTREALFANLRFDVPGENTERWEQPDEPIALDLAELRKLDSNEPAYGEALTRMLFRPDDVGRFYQDALTLTESSSSRCTCGCMDQRARAVPRPCAGSRCATRSRVTGSRRGRACCSRGT